jgi:hypothetical protein
MFITTTTVILVVGYVVYRHIANRAVKSRERSLGGTSTVGRVL